MKNYLWLTTLRLATWIGIAGLSLMIEMPCYAGNTNEATSARTPAANSGRTTVGDMLRQVDRGGKINKMEKKSSVALPQYQDMFETKKNTGGINMMSVKPPKSSSFFQDPNDDQAKLEKLLDGQIKQLFQLADKYKNTPQRGELWLRLAEVYVEKASYLDFRKQTEYDQKLKDYQSKKTKVKPRLDLREAKEYNKKAINLYEWFVRDFPKDQKMDQALFFLGYNNYELGDTKKGTRYYQELTQRFPKSLYVIESNFALAEFYFENEKWTEARTHYEQVIKYKRHRLFSFSLYKLAWCEFRSGNTEQALKYMEGLIRYGRETQAQADLEGKRNINKNRLESEGLRDIVLFYAEVGSSQQAPDYFERLVGADAPNYLDKLAYFYGDKGNIEGSRYLFNYLIEKNPTAPKAFDYKYQVVRLFSNAKQSKEFREELYSLVKDFGPSSAWFQTNIARKDLTDNAVKLREATLRNFILNQHQTAQNSRAPFSQALALDGYRLYIKEIDSSPVMPDMHFYYGELLYDMGKYDEAGAQYKWVVENGEKSKFYAKAAENTLIALEKDLPSDEQIAKNVGKSVEPMALDSKSERFVVYGKAYLVKVPNGEKAPEVKFRIGRLYYLHNQFDQATPYFKDIVKNYPKSKYAEYSANLLLDAFNLKKDYDGLSKAGEELLTIPSIANSKAGLEIKTVLEKASFKKGQDLELQKDFAGSAAQYESFGRKNLTSPLATTAFFNAGINYERSGQTSKSIVAHQSVLRSQDPKAGPLKLKSRRLLAKLYQDSGQLEEAAQLFEASAKESEGDPLVSALYYNAAILYEATGQTNKALSSYESYYKKSSGQEKAEALFAMANLAKRENRKAEAVKLYKEFLSMGVSLGEKNVEAAFYIAGYYKENGQDAEAQQYRGKTLVYQSRISSRQKGPGAKYAAKVLFDDALYLLALLKSTKIPAAPEQQKAAVEKKINILNRLNDELTKIIKYDSPEEIISSLSVLGQANVHMYDSILTAPTPEGLSAEQQGQYKAAIQKIADPFMTKGRDALKACLEKAADLDTYTRYYAQARKLMNRLDPANYYEGSEVGMSFRMGQWIGN